MGKTNQSSGETSFAHPYKPCSDREVAATIPKTFVERCDGMMLCGFGLTVISWVILPVALFMDYADGGQQSFFLLVMTFLEILAIIPALTGLFGFIVAAILHKKMQRAEVRIWRGIGKYREDIPGDIPLRDRANMQKVPKGLASDIAFYASDNT